MSNKDKDKESDSKLNVADIVKKVVSVGIGAAFMTEESVKATLKDIPLPKDIVTGLLQNAKTSKDEFVTTIRDEVRGLLSKTDVNKLLEELVSKYDIEINAKIKLHPKNDKDVQDNKDK
ncbi:MAG: hypothetical protein ACI9J3_002149 [Parvicellaceae bacterium]|jgi:hypothetical protein